MALCGRLMLALAQLLPASAWLMAQPAPPCNISVTSWPHSAEIRWLHGAGRGLATHYVIKWQEREQPEVLWHPEWVGVGAERIVLRELRPGRAYALRIAAVNTQGRAWSQVAVFQTVSRVRCADAQQWRPLLEEADVAEACGDDAGADDELGVYAGCSMLEYVFAGIAAGGTIALIGVAMLMHHPCMRGLLAPAAGLRPARLEDEARRLGDDEVLPYLGSVRRGAACAHCTPAPRNHYLQSPALGGSGGGPSSHGGAGAQADGETYSPKRTDGRPTGGHCIASSLEPSSRRQGKAACRTSGGGMGQASGSGREPTVTYGSNDKASLLSPAAPSSISI
jgi:hypothetical protein